MKDILELPFPSSIKTYLAFTSNLLLNWFKTSGSTKNNTVVPINWATNIASSKMPLDLPSAENWVAILSPIHHRPGRNMGNIDHVFLAVRKMDRIKDNFGNDFLLKGKKFTAYR
jgi:hypothetical protein